MLESGLLEAHGITRVGVAGHPEGSPDITAEQAADALVRKNELSRSLPFEFRIVTQFALAGSAYVEWERGIRAAGNQLPVVAGIPGVTSPPRLLKFALACGIGASLEVLRKQSGGLLKLATTRSWKPDEVVSTIAQSVADDPGSLIRGLHVFPFGGLEASAEWLAEARAAHSTLSGVGTSPHDERNRMDTVLESQSKTVVIGAGRPFCVIGERINPTGRKAFQAQLQAGDLSQIEIDVEEQLARRRHARRQRGRSPRRRGCAHGAGGAHDPGHDRHPAVHRLLGDRGARGRPGRVRGEGARELGHG